MILKYAVFVVLCDLGKTDVSFQKSAAAIIVLPYLALLITNVMGCIQRLSIIIVKTLEC